MSIKEAIKKEAAKTLTANGDVAYKTTYDANVDFFFSASTLGKGDNIEAARTTFAKALLENKEMAIKNLLYLRDIKQGQGVRTASRELLKDLAETEPRTVIKLLPHIVALGRWDDILELILVNNKEFKEDLVSYVMGQLTGDLLEARRGGKVSFLGKWLPSTSVSNHHRRRIAYKWQQALYPGPKGKQVYRRVLSTLRAHIKIVEHQVSARGGLQAGSVDYNRISGQGLKRYLKLFKAKDTEAYNAFSDSIQKDTGKAAQLSDRMYPHEILAQSSQDETLAESIWQGKLSRFSEEIGGKRTIVVLDTSYSMNDQNAYGKGKAIAIMSSQLLSGDFKDNIIIFSNEPFFVDLSSAEKVADKNALIDQHRIVESTNYQAVMELILNASKQVPEEDRIDQVIVLSDMEFNPYRSDFHYEESTHDIMAERFEEAGIKLPHLIYWNLNANRVVIPTQQPKGIGLVSGFSGNVLNTILSGGEITPAGLMAQELEKYDEIIEDIKKKGGLEHGD